MAVQRIEIERVRVIDLLKFPHQSFDTYAYIYVNSGISLQGMLGIRKTAVQETISNVV